MLQMCQFTIGIEIEQKYQDLLCNAWERVKNSNQFLNAFIDSENTVNFPKSTAGQNKIVDITKQISALSITSRAVQSCVEISSRISIAQKGFNKQCTDNVSMLCFSTLNCKLQLALTFNHSIFDFHSGIIILNEIIRSLYDEMYSPKQFRVSQLTAYKQYEIPNEITKATYENLISLNYKRQKPVKSELHSHQFILSQAQSEKLIVRLKNSKISMQSFVSIADFLSRTRIIQHNEGENALLEVLISRKRELNHMDAVGLFVEPMFIQVGIKEIREDPVKVMQKLTQYLKDHAAISDPSFWNFRYRAFVTDFGAEEQSIVASSLGRQCEIAREVTVEDCAFLAYPRIEFEFDENSQVGFCLHCFDMQGRIVFNWYMSDNVQQKEFLEVKEEFIQVVEKYVE